MSTIFTFPGKMGDSILQWPVAYHWAKETGQKFTAYMDIQTCKPLVPLIEAQPCVEEVKLIEGVENWSCGGQPFHMNLPTSAFIGNTIYHLGLRGFPARQISIETREGSRVPLKVSPETFASEPSLLVAPLEKKNRLIVHGGIRASQGEEISRDEQRASELAKAICKELQHERLSKIIDHVHFVLNRVAYPCSDQVAISRCARYSRCEGRANLAR